MHGIYEIFEDLWDFWGFMVFYLGLIGFFGDLLKYEFFAFKLLIGIYGIFLRL